MKLALLPTGEAVRPADVKRIRIEPAPPLLDQEIDRYRVVVELADEAPWIVKDGLSLEEATSLSRRCCQAINESLTRRTSLVPSDACRSARTADLALMM